MAWQPWTADHEAFLDHWGGHDDSEASFRRWRESPEYDPSLFLVAWEGDEIAGGVLNAIYEAENQELGLNRAWLDSVFARRPWRRRGLARNLIARSLHLLRGRGLTGAALGVDADNPSGALRLYRIGRVRRHRAGDGVPPAAGGPIEMIEVRPAVPSLAVRHYRGGDLPALHRVWSAAAAANEVEELKTLEDFRRDYASLVNCDLSRDLFLAEVGGEAVAYSRVFWQDLVDGGRSYENFGFVDPAWRGRGIGSTLHELNEERLREVADGHQDVAPKWLASEASTPMPAPSPSSVVTGTRRLASSTRWWHGRSTVSSGR